MLKYSFFGKDHLAEPTPTAPVSRADRKGYTAVGPHPGKTLTPLKFQALGEGNMGKLFCRCRLGLEEKTRQDNKLVTHGFNTQRKSPTSNVVSSERERPGGMAQADEAAGLFYSPTSLRSQMHPELLPSPPAQELQSTLKIVKRPLLKKIKLNLKFNLVANEVARARSSSRSRSLFLTHKQFPNGHHQLVFVYSFGCAWNSPWCKPHLSSTLRRTVHRTQSLCLASGDRFPHRLTSPHESLSIQVTEAGSSGVSPRHG